MIIFDDAKKVGRLGLDYLNNFALGKGGNIGSYGDINFIVSRYDQVVTPSNIDVKNQNKIEKFDNLGSKEYSQFRSAQLKTVSMTFKLLSSLANIPDFIDKVDRISENGEYYPIIIGNKLLSENDFIITTWNYKIIHTDASGQLEAIEAQLNFEEYIKRVVRNDITDTNVEVKKQNNNILDNKRLEEKEYKNVEENLILEEEELHRRHK